MSHLFLLGGSGRTGAHIIDYGLATGHTITTLVRDPSRVERRDGLTLVEGTPLNRADIDRGIEGADAVIVALNSSRKSDRPWSKPVSPPRLMADSIAHTTAAMEARGLRRIVIVSAFGVGDSLAKEPLLPRLVIKHTNLNYTYVDHNHVDTEIRTTDTDWTLLRPVALTDKPSDGRAPAVTDLDGPKPSFTIGREDVARFAVDIVDSGAYIRQAPILSRPS